MWQQFGARVAPLDLTLQSYLLLWGTETRGRRPHRLAAVGAVSCKWFTVSKCRLKPVWKTKSDILFAGCLHLLMARTPRTCLSRPGAGGASVNQDIVKPFVLTTGITSLPVIGGRRLYARANYWVDQLVSVHRSLQISPFRFMKCNSNDFVIWKRKSG